MKARPYLSIIIPAYNEAVRIGLSLSRLVDHLRTAEEVRGPVEVLVVDDGSDDGTAMTVEGFIADLSSEGPSFRLLPVRYAGLACLIDVLRSHAISVRCLQPLVLFTLGNIVRPQLCRRNAD